VLVGSQEGLPDCKKTALNYPQRFSFGDAIQTGVAPKKKKDCETKAESNN